ncbi:hypothetical protein FDP41_012190 [Naegleria fowleri]|uniref:Zn(2)-C6 fungal-type domain-containing protein n=1 Tax=Naegleria fowleri TaxID=5763 RepID=A0A6A5BTV7_NAEFO|nr:uncharacterized protein FDP41_012190 [Naegleria fowleri]KAF0981533.1 hypothetical protein FDP41_012190 [Naegleria fowleri]
MTKADVRPDSNLSGLEHPTTSTSKKEKKRKPYVKRACLSCHSAHVACDSERPCRRCKKKGIPCVDYIPSKKSKSNKTSTSDDDEAEQVQTLLTDNNSQSEPSNSNVVGDHPTTLQHDTSSTTTTTNTTIHNTTHNPSHLSSSSPEKSPNRKRKKKESCGGVLRVETPSSNHFLISSSDQEDEPQTSSCISNQSSSNKYDSTLTASKSSLVQHALSLSEKQNQKKEVKTLPLVVEKPKSSNTLIIEDDIENPLMATSPVSAVDVLSMIDGFATSPTTTSTAATIPITISQNSVNTTTTLLNNTGGVSTTTTTTTTDTNTTTNNSVNTTTTSGNISETTTKPTSVIYPYFYNPWWYMAQLQQNQTSGGTTNAQQQPQQQQLMGIPPYPVIFAPIPATQLGQQPFVYNPNSSSSSLPTTSQLTPTSPMQTDSAPSPSTAFPMFAADPYHLYGASFAFVPKPITIASKFEDLDVNSDGIVEESVAGILPQSEDTNKHVTAINDTHATTTDNLAIFDDIDYFESDTSRNNGSNSDLSVFTWQDSPSLEKKKLTRPASNRAISSDDEIIDLITSEASLLHERAKEQQNSNRQNGNVASNSISSSSSDNQSSLTTPEEINFVISQAPDNMLMKQKLGDIIKQIWQTQEKSKQGD